VILPEQDAEKALTVMRSFPEGADSRIVGRVNKKSPGMVELETVIGTTRIVRMITGDQLPRIC
jgi:hydrogenase expression/formation protein HypE